MADINTVDIMTAVSNGEIDEVNQVIRIKDEILSLEDVFGKSGDVKQDNPIF